MNNMGRKETENKEDKSRVNELHRRKMIVTRGRKAMEGEGRRRMRMGSRGKKKPGRKRGKRRVNRMVQEEDNG